MSRKSKLILLTDYEGYDNPLDMIESSMFDEVCPGICMNEGCDYTTNVEPDSDSGWCESCNTNTVHSAITLALAENI